jgi:hypothetical protein
MIENNTGMVEPRMELTTRLLVTNTSVWLSRLGVAVRRRTHESHFPVKMTTGWHLNRDDDKNFENRQRPVLAGGL